MAKYCFCGVSGSGMSTLAQILKKQGHIVCGSDAYFDMGRNKKEKKILEDLGILLFAQDGSMIADDVDCLFISKGAIKDDNPDVVCAKAKNVPIRYRTDLLASMFHQYKHSIAVAGTSGKTTTTAMIGYALDKLGQKPTVINGGILKNYTSENEMQSYIFNQGDICVIEADESDGSLANYHPYIGVVNNISVDHQPLEVLNEYFEDFATKCDYGLVINDDCENLKNISHHKNTFRYSTQEPISYSIKNPNASLYASNVKPIKNGVSYDLGNYNFKLNLLGEFNVSNALAAIGVCMLLGIDKYDAATALEGFLGTKRRLDIIGTKNNITVIDDFAHNPEKIYNSIKAIKASDGRVIAMFQPHGVPQMKIMGMQIMERYSQILDKDDILVMPEIFLAKPEDLGEMSSEKLIAHAKSLGVNAHFLKTKELCAEFIIKNAKAKDRIVVQGARDGSLPMFCAEILEEL